MSCKACNEKQDAEEVTIAFYRWQNANVGMIGCDNHLRQIFEALNKAQESNQQ